MSLVREMINLIKSKKLKEREKKIEKLVSELRRIYIEEKSFCSLCTREAIDLWLETTWSK